MRCKYTTDVQEARWMSRLCSLRLFLCVAIGFV